MLLINSTIHAVGTPAGTDIYNTATADYEIGGSGGSSSSTVALRVDEKLDVDVSWQDAANIGVSSPDADRVTTWLVTNTGNGDDSYSLTVSNAIAGDQFDPVYTDIWLDANGNGVFESALDTPYAPGVNDPLLAADASQVVFVRNAIPAGLNNGDLGYTALTAVSNTGSGLPGTAYAGAGDGSTAALVGNSGGSDAATGTHEVSDARVVLVKSVTITDPLGGNQPLTGATLAYRIDATVSGPGTAAGVIVADAIPANTSYTGGTLQLNGSPLSDVADADAGDVNATATNTVTVDLGDLTSLSPTQTIFFEVTIN